MADEQDPHGRRLAVELWTHIESREKAVRIILPDGRGEEFHLEINYVLFNQFIHVCLDALSFPDSNLTPEPILAGQVTLRGPAPQIQPDKPGILHRLTNSLLRGAGSLTKVPMPTRQNPNA